METIYGHFDPGQVEAYKTKIHKKIHWLLIYKDPNIQDVYRGMEFDVYFETLMKMIDGFNELVGHPEAVVELMAMLEAAYLETEKDPFDWKTYRRLILAAHSIVDRIHAVGGAR